MNKLYQDKEWLYNQYINLRKSMPEIAKECKCSAGTIYYWLIKHNIPIRTISEAILKRKEKLGYINSPEARKKVSETLKGKIPWNKGKIGIYSPETLKQMSESHKGKKQTEEHKKKISEANKGKCIGKYISKEHRQKISEANKGHIVSEETRQKISRSTKGNKHHRWNPNRAEVYAPYGENFYDKELRNKRWDLQRGRDLLTGEKLEWGFYSIFHHIDWDKLNDNSNNFCWLTRKNHGKLLNKRKRKYYQFILKNNLQTLKEGQIPKTWNTNTENLIQLQFEIMIIGV